MGYYDVRLKAVLAKVRLALGDRADNPDAIMTLEDAVAALGRQGVTEVGRCEVPVDQVVGTVSRSCDFDRGFRLLNPALADRWQSLARAAQSGSDFPPVDLVRLGDMYFVRDGHHRVSVSRALGRPTIAARVQWICTTAYAMACLTLAHLENKAAERLFLERVPLPDAVRTDLWLDAPEEWMRLADAAEAWAYRSMLAGRRLTDRDRMASQWWDEEVMPVISRLRTEGAALPLRDVQAYVSALATRDRLGQLDWTPDVTAELVD
ncbi:hypothetical protein [Fodinicola acaciae]|uniref:hypothetical protein n=1 Tax=Fodinicola acaciae TaxID=2681555 RepID=UPI0016525680|nr:hypothetical protein [Fodinicola acaciae]